MEMQMWFLLNFYQSILNVSFPTCHWITNFPGQKTQISITFVTLESNFLTCKTFGKSETSGIQSPRYLKDFSNGSRFELTTREGKGALRPLLLPSGWFGDRFTDTAKGASSKMTLNNKLFPRGTREETVALGTSQNDGITSHGTTKEGGWLEEEEEKKKKRKKQKQGNKEREREEKEVEARQWGQRQSRLYYRARPRWTVKRTPCAFSFIGPFRFITVAKSRSKLKRASRIFGPNSGRA